MPEFLTTPAGDQIAFEHVEGESPGIVFLGGFKSDMNGNKARAVAAWCRKHERQCTRFDYYGHGASGGAFIDGIIGRWLEDSLQVIDELCNGPQILVGSSMGGWIMLLAALARPDRIAGLLGIACAADFTERLIWQGLSSDQQNTLREDGVLSRPSAYDESPYLYTWQLIEEGRRHLLLDSGIDLHCPVRLVHGQQDVDVPWEISKQVMKLLASNDVVLTLIKNGDHRLSTESHLKVILGQLKLLTSK